MSGTAWKDASGQCHFLIFLIKTAFQSVCPQEQSVNPRRGLPHLFAEFFQRYLWAALNDKFIMDMTDNLAMGESPHGICQDVSADCLNDVLHEFRTVTFNPSPLPCVDAFIGHAVRTKLINTHTWFYIAEPPARWEINKEHTALIVDMKAMCFSACFVDYSLLHSGIYRPPKAGDALVGGSPCVNKWL